MTEKKTTPAKNAILRKDLYAAKIGTWIVIRRSVKAGTQPIDLVVLLLEKIRATGAVRFWAPGTSGIQTEWYLKNVVAILTPVEVPAYVTGPKELPKPEGMKTGELKTVGEGSASAKPLTDKVTAAAKKALEQFRSPPVTAPTKKDLKAGRKASKAVKKEAEKLTADKPQAEMAGWPFVGATLDNVPLGDSKTPNTTTKSAMKEARELAAGKTKKVISPKKGAKIKKALSKSTVKKSEKKSATKKAVKSAKKGK